MNFALFTLDGALFILRWIHFLAGITWIGLLYYFNFVQGEFFKEIDGPTKKTAQQKLLPRALAWFRWGAMFTFLAGLLLLSARGHPGGFEIYSTSWGVTILIGSALGTLMFLNVWLVIWPNQKVVIAVANGATHANVADCAARAAVASRVNVLFSIPMLFLMGAASHLPIQIDPEANFGLLTLILTLLFGAIEWIAVKGKMMKPITTITAVIHTGLAFALVIYFLIEFLV